MRPQSFMQATAFYKGRDVRCHWQTAESTGGAAAAYKQRRTLPAPVYRPSTAPHRLPIHWYSQVTHFVPSPFVRNGLRRH
jgi:hypothetical protein